MAMFKCKMCGGDLDILEDSSVATCEYCGSMQTVPTADNEKKMTLFARANRLRLASEFDKAAGVYETIVADFPEEAEAYWGLVLCKYGIEYVDDPATGKKIPTCHRSSFDNVMDDPDLDLALEYTDATARRIYREEAKAIEQIRRGIVQVSANEDPYDIFICYKETDPEGNRTLDSVLAQDIYDALTDKGYRTFFARISLEDKLGQEYEPYIFAALNSAKIMLAIGTDYEYFNAVWVKNEWSRFLKLMTADKSKHLIPCFKGIDAYDMPKEFARLQAQDLGKVGAIQDLLRGIGKLLPKQATPVSTPQPTGVSNALTMRGQFALEDNDFAKAEEYFERALDQNPQDGQAYLGKVLVSLRLTNITQLDENLVRIHDNKDYDRAIRFSEPALSRELTAIRERAHKKYLVKCLTVGLKKIHKKKVINQEKEDAHRLAEEACRRAEEETRRRTEVLRQKRAQLQSIQKHIAVGHSHIAGLRSNGTVVTTGSTEMGYNASNWTDIVAVAAGWYHTVGLRADGTVVTTKHAGNDAMYHGQCDVENWKNIVAIAAGSSHTVGLRSDGTVISTKYVGDARYYYGMCDVSGWTDIVAIAANDIHTVGLRSDGTVVAAGKNSYRHCNVNSWNNITAIATGATYTIGLHTDGTVVAVGENRRGQCNVTGWTDIVAIAAGYYHAVGLRADGTVVAVGSNDNGECNVKDWTDIVAIAAGCYHTVGLRADGTMVATKFTGESKYYRGPCSTANWKLFNSINGLVQEQEVFRRRWAEEAARRRTEKISSLKSEKASIEAELPNIKGLFSGGKRSKLEARLAEIETELSKLS